MTKIKLHWEKDTNIYLQGPSELGEEVAVQMDTVTGVTKVLSIIPLDIDPGQGSIQKYYCGNCSTDL